MDLLRPTVGFALALTSLGCAEGPAYSVKYAPGFTPSRAPVAIFGVFQSGRMSPAGWVPLAPKVSAAFGEKACPIGFSDALQRADIDLYTQLDEDVAENGITDELLAKVAPKTDAELVITISVHGKVERVGAPAVGEDPTLPGHRPSASGGGRRRSGGSKTITWSGLELSASLYSVKLARSVGRISVRYHGTSVDEAATLFAQKVGEELGAATCRPWTLAPSK